MLISEENLDFQSERQSRDSVMLPQEVSRRQQCPREVGFNMWCLVAELPLWLHGSYYPTWTNKSPSRPILSFRSVGHGRFPPDMSAGEMKIDMPRSRWFSFWVSAVAVWAVNTRSDIAYFCTSWLLTFWRQNTAGAIFLNVYHDLVAVITKSLWGVHVRAVSPQLG